jgi:hypothetical protein
VARNTPFLNLVLQADVAADDSDKTLTVPAGKQWHVRSIGARLVSTGTVGNRQLDVLITDGSDNLLIKLAAGAVQAASLTRDYTFAPGLPNDTAFANGAMARALPLNLVLPAGYKVRVYDSAAVDAAADDLTVRALVEEWSE